MTLSKTAVKAIEAYGGSNLWNEARSIRAIVSAKGLAFSLKRRPFFKNAQIAMSVDRPWSSIMPIGKNQAFAGVLDGNDVRVEHINGDVVDTRKDARAYFPFGRRLFYWDDLDMAYFANYAFWNYFTLPRLLMRNDIDWNEKAGGILEATFPEHIPTHCKNQVFYFDTASGLLKQHNYTANVIGKLAHAANVVQWHSKDASPTYPAARKVTPRGFRGRPLRLPVLIDIKVHQFKVSNQELPPAWLPS
jgi:hypothetical protein